jgi:hypothetical protein
MTNPAQPVSRTYVEFDKKFLEPGSGEGEMIDKIVEKLRRNNEWTFKKYKHGLRDAHSKSHAVVRGELLVDSALDPQLAQGLFATGEKRYDVMARISSTFPTIRSDQIRGIRAIAIKVFDVQGSRARKDNASTQDFVLVNHSTFPYAGARAYLRKAMWVAWLLARVPDWLLKPFTESLAWVVSFFHIPVPYAVQLLIQPNYEILGLHFSSASAVRYGGYVAKISLVPLSESVTELEKKPIPRNGGDDAHRVQIAEFFANNLAEYEVQVQLCTDPRTIEDATLQWSDSPQRVAKIVFPQQNSDCFCRRVYADDLLSFNSWTGLEDHTPLGSINRLKAKVYDASSEFRHTKNNAPRIEPTGIAQLPLCKPGQQPPCATGQQPAGNPGQQQGQST